MNMQTIIIVVAVVLIIAAMAAWRIAATPRRMTP
jgi:hypothetical protein